jgi:hypothetical protein
MYVANWLIMDVNAWSISVIVMIGYSHAVKQIGLFNSNFSWHVHHRHPIVIIISTAHMVWSSRTSVSSSQWTSSIAWRGRDAPATSRVFGFPKIPSRVFAEYRSLSTSRETSQNRRPLDFLVDVNSLKSTPAPRQLNDVSVNLYQT